MLCSGTNNCTEYGIYDPSKSNTSKWVNDLFEVLFVGSNNATGSFFTDEVQLAGTSVGPMQFGLANQSTTVQPVWGIGYGGKGEDLTAQNFYNNTPLQLMANGAIGAAAYSLWLNDLKTGVGSILFGGVDTARFVPPLQSVPIIPFNGSYVYLQITLNSINASMSGGSSYTSSTDLPQTAVLDSGAAGIYLPGLIAKGIWTTFGASYQTSIGYTTCPCSLQSNTGSVNFTFSGINISVPVGTLVRTDPTGSLTSGNCFFDVLPLITNGGFSPILLGDSFLRNAYVVYDLSNNEIALAQTVFEATSSNIMEITNGTNSQDGIPSVTAAPSIVTGVPTPTGSISPTGIPSGTSTAFNSLSVCILFGVLVSTTLFSAL